MTADSLLQTREHQLIEAIRSWTGSAYIGDDCAILPGRQLVTSDTLVEGTHFDLDLIGLSDLGWKAVAVNLSDIAAMGGSARFLVVNLTLPQTLSEKDFGRLYRSIAECGSRHRCQIVGGDLTGGSELSITITVLGDGPPRGCLKRSGAGPGQVVAVTGDFGGSAAGLAALRAGDRRRSPAVLKHCRPQPRLKEAAELAERVDGAGALMDASDGLADALVQISRASRSGMEIDLSAVPIAADTRALAERFAVDPLDWALYGGEDYELVACVPDDLLVAWEKAGACPFTRIGRVTEGDAVELTDAGGRQRRLDLALTFQHW